MSTAPWPGTLRRFLEQLDGLRTADPPDLEEVGRLLVDLAADQEFFDPLIAELPSAEPGDRWLIRPEQARAWCLSTGRIR
jgi:hypothetical protein